MRSFVAAVVSCAIVAGALADPAEDVQDYTYVPLGKIGVTAVKPVVDRKTGFIVGGKNATKLIRKLTQINGRIIADLEKDMRPGAIGKRDSKTLDTFIGSTKGFLGKEEKLLAVLAMDNEFVVDKLGLTHQDIARPLLMAAAIGHKNRFKEEATAFRYHKQDYRIKMICYKGYQFSPFYDKTATSCDAVLENVTAQKKLKYSPLVPHMIERYGFYEGKGTPYRVEPAAVIEMFPFLKAKERSNLRQTPQ